MKDTQVSPPLESQEGSLLHFPLKDQLNDPLMRVSLSESWNQIEERLDQARGGTGAEGASWWSSFGRRFGVSGFAALAAAFAVIFVLWGPGLKRNTAPLRLVDSSSVVELQVPEGGAPRQIAFEDGSTVQLKEGELRSLDSAPSEVALRLTGRAKFSVTPGGTRKWTVTTKEGTVEVLGTIFGVSSGEGILDVHVERGVVLVRSPLLPGGQKELRVGQSLHLRDPALQEAPETRGRLGAAPPNEKKRQGQNAAALTLEELFEGFPKEVVAARKESAAAVEGPTASELQQLADAARTAGRLHDAAGYLRRLVETHPQDPRAGTAAFSLGTIELEALNLPSQAIQSFQSVLRLPASASLKEDAYRRWFDALLRMGNSGEARSVLHRYRSAYPGGHHDLEMESALDAAASSKKEGTR